MSPNQHAPLDRDAIVGAAMTLLDTTGLADLTMRRLADSLDVRASALYWHVDSKQALLAAIADAIVAEASLEQAADPAPVAVRLRQALLAHRDAADVVISSRALALGGDGATAALLRALKHAHPNLPPTRAESVAATLLAYLLGHVSLTQQRRQAIEFGVVHADVRALDDSATQQFETGLDLILRGIVDIE